MTEVLHFNQIHYGEQYDLCSDERFFDQHTAAFVSGFLVHPEYIITAGHCMKSTYDCNNTRFIFDFALHALEFYQKSWKK